MFQQLFGFGKAAPSGVTQITVADLKGKLAAKEALQLIDVRSAEEFEQDGKIEGARLIPLPALSSRMSDISKETPVAVICRSGSRSHVAAEMLARAGYTNVFNVQGGMIAWRRAGYPAR